MAAPTNRMASGADASATSTLFEGPTSELALPDDLQELYIPVHEAVRLWPSELRIVNHPSFARLGDIYQLGQTHFVYRGATHRRFEHALGVVHVCQLMIDAIERNYRIAMAKGKPSTAGEWFRDAPLRMEEIAFVRLAGLVHDIGHVAAGHTLEDELGLLDSHDADKRLVHIFDRRDWRGVVEQSTLREIIDEEYATFATATEIGQPASEILLNLISKTRHAAKVNETSSFRLDVCRDLVGNTICADLLDYLHRDLHHIGKPRHFDTRLLDYLEVRRRNDERPSDAHLVIDVRGGGQVRPDAISEILDLLDARYQLGEFALFHRTKLCAAAMLERAVSELDDVAGGDWFSHHLDELLDCSDDELLALIATAAREFEASAKGKRVTQARMRAVQELARSLRYRQLHKQFTAWHAYDLGGGIEQRVNQLYAGKKGAPNRLTAVRSLEADFGLPPGSIVMYCPPHKMHAKVAEVQVLVHDQVAPLVKVENESSDFGLTGGILRAQLNRFGRLWRVMFGISPRARDLLDDSTSTVLARTIECLVLGRYGAFADGTAAARHIAGELTHLPQFEGKVVAESLDVHRRGGAGLVYPTDAPTLRSLLVDRS